MAKKVRFSLEMKNGVEVTDLESLKENFDIEKVKQYMIDGRLLTWLQDRYYEDEADEVEELATDISDSTNQVPLLRKRHTA